MFSNKTIPALLCALLMAATAYADGPVDGVMGLSVVHSHSYMAVWVPLEADQAIAGVQWYHNDGTAPVPSILATAGTPDDPGTWQDAVPVAETVSGASLQWCRQTFTQDVASTADGLYVLFQLPLGSVYEQDGTGGGAGVGYTYVPGGPGAWLSLDGQSWLRLHPDYRLAIEPVLTDAGSTTLRLERTAGKSLSAGAEPTPLRTELLLPTPNPFNPQATLRFTLERAGRIDLSVYDLRGRRVARLAEGPYAAGYHEVVWRGRDADDRIVASGLYLARLKANDRDLTQRMMLLR